MKCGSSFLELVHFRAASAKAFTRPWYKYPPSRSKDYFFNIFFQVRVLQLIYSTAEASQFCSVFYISVSVEALYMSHLHVTQLSVHLLERKRSSVGTQQYQRFYDEQCARV